MSNGLRMVRVTPTEIARDKPLKHAIFTVDGALLAAQGAKVRERDKLAILRYEGWRQSSLVGQSADDHHEHIEHAPPHGQPLRLNGGNPAPLAQSIALVADDVPLAVALLSRILTEQGVRRIITAEDGKRAISCFFSHTPNLILLDIDMPHLDGIGALKQIKAWSPEAFVCLVSANSTRVNVQAARQYRVDGFLVKPYSTLNIQRVLAKYQQRLPNPPS